MKAHTISEIGPLLQCFYFTSKIGSGEFGRAINFDASDHSSVLGHWYLQSKALGPTSSDCQLFTFLKAMVTDDRTIYTSFLI